MTINPDDMPTLEECQRDESKRPPFVWNPTVDELAYWRDTDPWI